MTVTQNGAVLSSSAYAISPVNNSYDNGGSVTLNTACTNGQTLVLQRVTPITQLTQFTPYMPALYADIEDGLDQLTEIDQELYADYTTIKPACGTVPIGIPCGGTGATTAAGALANLGGLPLSGGTLTGALNGTSASFSGAVSAGSETLGSPLLPASGGTGATTAAGALANLGGAAISGAAFTGPVSAPSINNIQYANTFTGATASEKIIACLAAAGNGTCDATGLTGAQTMDATVEVGASSIAQSLILSRDTLFEPTGASTPPIMFKVDRNGQIDGPHVVLPSGFSYAGKVIDVEDTITGGTQSPSPNSFSMKNVFVDGSAESSNTAYCLYIAPPAGSYIQLINIDNVNCSAVYKDIYLYAVGTTNTYISAITFNQPILSSYGASSSNITFDAEPGSLMIYGVQFNAMQLEGTGCGITYMGGAVMHSNIFTGYIFDVNNPVCDNSLETTAFGAPFYNAYNNTFTGGSDNPIVDPQSTSALYPNIYNLKGGITNQSNATKTSSTPYTATLSFPLGFTNGVSNQKIDLYLPTSQAFNGEVLVSLTDIYAATNNYGSVKKLIMANTSATGTIYGQSTRYVEAEGTYLAGTYAINDLAWDSTNSRYKITIACITPANCSTSPYLVANVQAFVDSNSILKSFMNMAASAVYTTDATVYPTPVVSYPGAVIATGGVSVGTLVSPIPVIPQTALGYQGPAAGYVTTSISGTATLVSGTVTVSSTAACAVSSSCHYSLTRYATNSSVAIGNLSVGTISAGSSFVINSLTATDTIATTDVSSVSWQVN
jgi:hypothetical protein